MLYELHLQPLAPARKNTAGGKQALARLPKAPAQCRQTTGWPGKRHSLVFSTDGKKAVAEEA